MPAGGEVGATWFSESEQDTEAGGSDRGGKEYHVKEEEEEEDSEEGKGGRGKKPVGSIWLSESRTAADYLSANYATEARSLEESLSTPLTLGGPW